MDLNLNFDIEEQLCCSDCCSKIVIKDTTCEYNPMYPAQCCDGYGVLDVPTVYDIDRVSFNWILPSGAVNTCIETDWTPGRRGRTQLVLSPSGTNGSLAVKVNGNLIGYSMFITDMATTIYSFVSVVNAIGVDTGYRASYDEDNDIITIETLEPTDTENGKPITLEVTGDLAGLFTNNFIDEGTSNTRSLCLNSNDIYGSRDLTPCDGNIEDGVHKVTYIVYNDLNEEIARKTNNVLKMCNLIACMENAKKLQMDGQCGCSKRVIDKRLLEIRLQMEIAETMMAEGKCDCANELVIELGKKCKNICLDCD